MFEILGGGAMSLQAIPPVLPLLAETIHDLGLLLLIGLVALPAAALAGSAWRDARENRHSGPRIAGRGCAPSGAA
jgi:hypothetical protein